MTNVGENPAEHSIISTFNIAVSGYAPIVWLPKDSGMDNLHKVMTTLFASLARDPKLPEKLVSLDCFGLLNSLL